MATSLNDISDILKGAEEQGAGKSPPKVGAPASGLNQLSDAADMAAKHETKAPVPAQAPAPAPVALPSQINMSQDALIDAAQQMQFQQPSQPDIPPPMLPESQGASQPAHPGEEMKAMLPNPASLATAGLDPNMLMNMMAAGGSMAGIGMEQLASMGNFYGLGHLGSAEDEAAAMMGGGSGNRSKGKKQTRRGPMDEMRQLIRILVKVFPHSIALIGNTEEAGGGNRISEEQIKSYIDKALGEAPRPAWGVPAGWPGYLAELFSWATGKVISADEASKVAKREPGRSWEALEMEMHVLGVHPSAWPLPLTLAGVQEAEKNPVALPIPPLPAIKRGEGEPAAAHTSSKRTKAATERDFSKLDEADLWKMINDALTAAVIKNGHGHDPNAVLNLKATAKNRMDEIMGASAAAALNPAMSSMYQYIPINMMEGSANVLSMLQGLPMPGMTGAEGGDAAVALAAATAAVAAASNLPDGMGDRAAKRQRKGAFNV